MEISLIPICFTANSNKELNNSIDTFRKYLNNHNMQYLLTNFSEYQQNNHKHYHSQLFITKEHKNKVLEYCAKHKPSTYASELINYEYVIKEIKPKYINFNSNLQNYNINNTINFFKQIFMANYPNFHLVSNEYISILKKILKRYNMDNKNFGNNGGKKMVTGFNELQLQQLQTLINTALEHYLHPNSEVLGKLFEIKQYLNVYERILYKLSRSTGVKPAS